MMKTIQGYTYKVSEHIGKGYSSTVHKGINDRNGEEVSIKVIEMAKLQDPINQMLLQQQVSALKKLSFSKHILHLYDVYATKNNTYIVTQLLQGDLGNMLKQRKQLPYYQAVEILGQLINGYLDVYRNGFLHRDIKPANIFYKNGVYKLGDFGFAIPANEISKHKEYNVGSPVYMPPQALKDNNYSVSCDTWALGIIFFQMIKGVVPWRAISQQKLHEKQMNQPLDVLTVGIPEIARQFLHQVLNLDASKRPKPQQMLSWPAQLSAVQIRPLSGADIKHGTQIRHGVQVKNVSPFKSTSPMSIGKQQPLQQIKYNSNNSNNNHHFNHMQNQTNLRKILTNKQQQIVSPCNTHKNGDGNARFFQKERPPLLSKQKYQSNLNNTTVNQQSDHQTQCSFISSNLIHYLKLIHRVIKFVAAPTKIPLPELEACLTNYLFHQFDLLCNLKDPNETNHNENLNGYKVQKWDQFLTTKKGSSFIKKLGKCEAKYKMFHAVDDNFVNRELNENMIKNGIYEIIKYLENQDNFNQKLVIAADYLTTFYQLFLLKNKSNELNKFFKVSKIDLIMQGNPYNVSLDHLAKLKKKLNIINL